MMIRYPDWILELMEKCKPYMDGCELREDAPEEIKEDFKKIDDWFDSTQGPYDQKNLFCSYLCFGIIE